jgi:eukaryotic-like serine/threonine-protein kinase
MMPERWHRVTGIFYAALARDQADRAAFVASSCGDDAALRHEVEAMLSAHEQADRLGEMRLLSRDGGDAAVDGARSRAFRPMSLSVGTRLGPYEILALIGAGGMGEVYRARDTRLGRTVAIKILPSLNANLKARFAREANVIASISHRNICTLYDVGQQGAIDYLVMEHLEGQTLAARLEHGPLKFPDVLKYATEIAEGLDAAHRAGVIHRDLKPANIMLTSGGAKLLDFGVAKLRLSDTSELAAISTVADSPPLTRCGTIIGTPQYMAPEQLEGKEADARSDLFALGAILYEMVTGRKAFQGGSPASLIAAIMSAEPAIAELEKLSPPGFDNLVRTCLIKSPDDRRQTAHDVVLDLQWIAKRSADSIVASPARDRRWPWIAAGIVLVSVTAGMTRYLTTNNSSQPSIRVSILPPENEEPVSFPAISPDGSRLVFCARLNSGEPILWIRALSASTFVLIPGTEGARDPFWSPDSRSIGFFANGKLKTVGAELGAGPPSVQTLADAPQPRGGTWSPDGTIVFARNIEDGLYRVPASGGDVTAVTTLDRRKLENSHRWPQFFPDGRHLLFLSRSASVDQGIYAGTPGSSYWKLLLRTPLNALVVSAPKRAAPWDVMRGGRGYLIFMREQTALAQPFDLVRLELTGEPSPIAEAVGTDINRGMFSVSTNSTLAYRSRTDDLRFGWFDRTGRLLEALESAAGEYPRLSADSKHIAFDRVDAQSVAGDIWIDDVSRGIATRLTFHPAYDWTPVWAPDGTRVAFASNRDGAMDLYTKSIRAAESEQQVFKSAKRKIPTDWCRSQEGEFLVFQQEDAATGWDLWALPMAGDRRPFPILASRFNETQGAVSPDGKWLAYRSDETGSDQVYIQPFTKLTSTGVNSHGSIGKVRLSANGGVQPRWQGDGKQLFYVGSDRRMMSVRIRTVPSFEAAMAVPLFTTTIPALYQGYDVTLDGSRFLAPVSGDQRPAPLTLLLNWTHALKN